MSSRARLAIYGVLLFATSLLAYGYRMDGNNQAVQLALVKWLNDPSLYPNDPYAISLGYYGSALWPLVARLAKSIPLQPLLFGLFVVERLLGIAAAGALARKFAPRSSLAAVAAMALMAWPITPMLGGGTIVKRYFEQTGFSIPFFLFAAAAFLDSRFIPWAILLAIGFNLNSIYGIYAVAYFAGAFLLSASHRPAWRQWLAACAVFLALASPALVRGFSLMHRSSGADEVLWMSAASVRSLHHLYPLSFGAGSYMQSGLLLGILMFFLCKNRHAARPLVAHGIAWTVVCFFWLGLAFAAAYVIKKPSLLMLQPARATDLWVCVASILIVSLAALDLERAERNGRIAFVVFALAFIGVVRPGNAPFLIAACVVLPLLPLVWPHLLADGNTSRLSLCMVVLVCSMQSHTFWSRWRNSASFTDALVWRIPAPVETIASWARTHSPKDAVFLIDPDADKWNHFRQLSERSIFTNWEEGAAINWDRSFASEWIRRLRILGYDIITPSKNLDEFYASLTDEDVRQISVQTRVDCWVVPVSHASDFPTAFSAADYKVLQIR